MQYDMVFTQQMRNKQHTKQYRLVCFEDRESCLAQAPHPGRRFPAPGAGSTCLGGCPQARSSSKHASRLSWDRDRLSWDDLEAETCRKSKLMVPEPEETGEVVDEMIVNGLELCLKEMKALRITMGSEELC